MTRNIFKCVFLILLIGWGVLVFMLSNQVADESSQTSGNTIKFIIKLLNPNITEEKLYELSELLQPFIRKLAHFVLYIIGGILIYANIYLHRQQVVYPKLISILLGACYAVSDEIHQLYVPGRSGEVRDILIDSFGIIVGVYLLNLTIYMINRRKPHEKKR